MRSKTAKRGFQVPAAERDIWLARSKSLRTRGRKPGGGEPLRAASLKTYWDGYVGALKCLQRAGLYDPQMPADERWTPECIAAITSAKKESGERYAPRTIMAWLSGVNEVLKAIKPKFDRFPLRTAMTRVERVSVREKVVVDADDLKAYGKGIMDAALKAIREGGHALKSNGSVPLSLMRDAREFRTGLQIYWLAVLALRLRNLAMTEFDKHLRDSDPWWLMFTRDEMKGRRIYDRPLPQELTDWIKAYRDEVRPILCRGTYSSRKTVAGKALWVSSRGAAQTAQSIRKNVQMLTKRKFKVAIPPHWFRDAVTTTIARKEPERASHASWVLTNGVDIAAAVYNHAGPAPARIAVSKRMAGMRASKVEEGLSRRCADPIPPRHGDPSPTRDSRGDVRRRPVLGRVIARLAKPS